jgi:Domain of unknown function (DUF4477)
MLFQIFLHCSGRAYSNMEFWNELNLSLPLYSSYKTSRQNIDTTKFTKVLQETIDFFRNMETLHNEAAQLSRFIFINCKQFRMMKGLHEMKKSHQALLRYLNMDLATSMETLKGFIADEPGGKVNVPYRQSLDYILIRLQGLAKLLIRVVECSKYSASFFLGLIKAGSFYMKGVIFLSTLASVWNKSREFCKFIVVQYNILKEFQANFKEKPGVKWIDGQYELPEKLDVWLGEDYEKLIINKTYDIRLLLQEEELKIFIENNDTINNALRRIKVEDDGCEFAAEEMFEEMTIEDNFSNELEIEDFTPIPRTIKKEVLKEEQLEHCLSSLTSKDNVMKFLKNESMLRKIDPKKSLSINKMKKKAWKEFKNEIERKKELLSETTFINYVKDYLEECEVKE